MPNFYKPSTAIVVFKTDLQNHYRCSTNFAVDETVLMITYRANIYKPSRDSAAYHLLHMHSTGFTVVKTCIAICYRCSTGFPVVKMYLLNIYKLSTGSAVVKTCMNILHRTRHNNPVQAFN